MVAIPRLPARHVHLDFHTSEHAPGVGSRFSRKQFQKALKLGNVNNITVFAKCHHSWAYYPTRAGHKHPTLKIDLLGEQIAACHQIGVRCPIYITVGWSANDAERHPEWCARNLDGSIAGNWDSKARPTNPKPDFAWKNLCVNTAYADLIYAQTQEICDAYDVDGLFYDICIVGRCYCDACRADMTKQGIRVDDSPESIAAASQFYTDVWTRFFTRCSKILHARHANATCFFNGRAGFNTPAEHLALQTHYELEDLPTTWGGYDKFAPRGRFFQSHDTPEKQILAMSGKFHTAWGEFGGYKHPDAIRFEAASMIAYGAICSFGDQLHPTGEMDPGTYRNLGEAYRYVEQIEEYGIPFGRCSTLAIYFDPNAPGGRNHEQGVANMLLESQLDFDMVEPTGDFSRYDTIILPGRRSLTAETAKQLDAYVKAGGSLLILSEAGLLLGSDRLALDFGAKYLGPARHKEDYLVPGRELSRGPHGLKPECSPTRSYNAALRVKPAAGASTLATIREPYFDRTYAHYCSHQNTPYRTEDAPHVAAVQKGRIVYLAHPWGEIYHNLGARLHRDFVINALRRIYRKPLIETSMPSAGRVSLNHQPDQRRYVAHLLYGTPLKRGSCLIIEDLVELRNVPVTLRVPEKVRRAILPLTGEKLPITRKGAALCVTVPSVHCHQIVVFEY